MKTTQTRVLLTAAEVYPELERAVLAARSEVRASFRIFDPRTRLRSEEAQTVGETWFDLILHLLNRGIPLNLAISDFDPVGAPDLHRGTWRSVRMLLAAAELAGPGAPLHLTAATHPARTGVLPGSLFAGLIVGRLSRHARDLNRLPPAIRARRLGEMPGLARLLRQGPDGALQPRLWPLPRLVPTTHHQKLAVIDRKVLFIGGLDLDERRWDTPEHRRSSAETWHDVMVRIENGPVVAEAQTHLETFLDVTAGTRPPAPHRRLLRTLSRPRRIAAPFIGPKPLVNEIAEAHLALARRARRLIYLETQFFRDRRLAKGLAGLGRENPGLNLILILPAAPEDVAFGDNAGADARLGEFLQGRCLRILRRAFGSRMFVGGAAQPRRAQSRTRLHRDTLDGAPLVYIHAKVSVFDARWAIVSSANLNGRSLRWDTECGVFLNAPRDVAALRRRMMAHWLPREAGERFYTDKTAVAAWTALARANAAAAPENRRGFILPYDLGATEEFGAHVSGLPEELV